MNRALLRTCIRSAISMHIATFTTSLMIIACFCKRNLLFHQINYKYPDIFGQDCDFIYYRNMQKPINIFIQCKTNLNHCHILHINSSFLCTIAYYIVATNCLYPEYILPLLYVTQYVNKIYFWIVPIFFHIYYFYSNFSYITNTAVDELFVVHKFSWNLLMVITLAIILCLVTVWQCLQPLMFTLLYA